MELILQVDWIVRGIGCAVWLKVFNADSQRVTENRAITDILRNPNVIWIVDGTSME
jgi:hypothetical protein